MVPRILQRNGIQLTVDQMTCLIGEQYVNDFLNYLMNLFEEDDNTLSGKITCLAVGSLMISSSEELIVKSFRQYCLGKDVSQLEAVLTFNINFLFLKAAQQ